MKTKIPFILALLSAGMIVHAAPPPNPTVAVYEFKGEAGAARYSADVTTLVTADLTTETNLAILERAELSKALSEQAFGVSGIVSSDAAAQIGQITGAKILVAGQVIKIGDNHLVLVANIIGTETGRLYADKVEGAAENLMDLTSDLSRKIAETIRNQTTNLILAKVESSTERVDRIIKSINGTNRPSVSVRIVWTFNNGPCKTAQTEFGIILLKAGFAVVDGKSDRKPDVEITGVIVLSEGPKQGDLYSMRSVIDLKMQERTTGNIIGFDHQDATATDGTSAGANRTSIVNAVDALAERVLPLLAK